MYTFPVLTPAQWAIGIIAALIIGASKTGIPGIGVLAVVLLPFIFPARETIGMAVPMLLFADCFAVWWFSKYTRWDKLTQMLPWVIGGMLLGAVALFVLGEHADAKNLINIVIGAMVLIMVALYVARLRLGNRMTPTTVPLMAATGIGAGIATAISNAAGPLMIMYMARLGLDKNAFMGTTAWYFFIFNAVKIPLYLALDWLNPAQPLVTARGLSYALTMLPVIVIGVLIGRWLLSHLSQRVFNWVTVIGATAGALRLIWTGLG